VKRLKEGKDISLSYEHNREKYFDINKVHPKIQKELYKASEDNT
jgi:hypothetical protein